ncbi:LytTR family transcriptional regulator [Sphingobacterium alkalisoli]|uniref:LytTR family transcriptional regulator n=2 Tax=Sphingobacterium alkalisoli TaxID=1874115 RepID=A0A4U0H305_9SPHI|nr:LytTR family transcriptional regulator [Sphingobacterium alkalisoli]GGH20240.1 hypothetical protein GCM10011418_25280 [Sphingobacterium alkalisoli]
MIQYHEKLTLLFQEQHKLRYFPIYAQVILSILVSHYLCGPNTFFSMKNKWDNEEYWIVLGFSFLIAMVIFTLAQWMNKRLDKEVPWLPHFCKRMRLQVIFGVVGMMLCELTLMYLIFGVGYAQGWSWMLKYMSAFTMPVGILVVIMNLVYLSWYMWSFAFFATKYAGEVTKEAESLVEQLTKQKKLLSNDSPFLLSLKVMNGYKQVALPVKNIAFIKSAHNKRFCEARDSADRYTLTDPLDQLIQYLDSREFYKVNRNYILHRSIIAKAEMLNTGQLKLLLTSEIDAEEEILVSRESAEHVKKWLEKIGVSIS